jgi:hypothetical protein
VEIKTDVALDTQDINTVIVPKLQEIGYENPKITVSQSEGVSTMLIQVNVDNSEAVQKLSTIVNEYIGSK